MLNVTVLYFWVIVLNVFAAAMVVLRSVIYRTRLYRPMLVNIGLSILPIFILGGTAIVGLLAMSASRGLGLGVMAAGMLVWLLVLPNAGYLITELNFSHRKDGDGVPLWFDIVLTLSLAMSGVVNTVVNVSIVQLLWTMVVGDEGVDALRRSGSWWLVIVVIVVMTFGMYLGRYLRLNSWDVLHPFGFAKRLGGHFRQRGELLNAVLYCLFTSMFFGIMYMCLFGWTLVGV